MGILRRGKLISWVAAGVLALAGAGAGSGARAETGAASGAATATGAATEAAAPTASPRGPVTNLPLPRFVTLKASEANVRRGPSLTHRIDWMFTTKGMPLEVVGEYGNWRRVRDHDGVGGWVHYTLLSGARAGLVESPRALLHMRPDPASAPNAELEAGVIVALDRCGADWCQGRAGGFKGWVTKAHLWGVGAGEVFD